MISSGLPNSSLYSRLLVLAVLLLLGSCKTRQEAPSPVPIKVSRPWIFSEAFNKAVYKTVMEIYGNELSGLTVIKKSSDSYHVVLVSEVGLKYVDMEFTGRGEVARIHYLISFLNRKQVSVMLEENYRMLFMACGNESKEHYYPTPETGEMVMMTRCEGKKIRYTFNNNFGMVSKASAGKAGKEPSIDVWISDHLAPDSVSISRKNMRMELTRLE